MANKTLFKSLIGKLIPATDAINEERAPAYALSPKHQLAQYAATGCLNTTFYATADEQLAKVLELCAEGDQPEPGRLQPVSHPHPGRRCDRDAADRERFAARYQHHHQGTHLPGSVRVP